MDDKLVHTGYYVGQLGKATVAKVWGSSVLA